MNRPAAPFPNRLRSPEALNTRLKASTSSCIEGAGSTGSGLGRPTGSVSGNWIACAPNPRVRSKRSGIRSDLAPRRPSQDPRTGLDPRGRGAPVLVVEAELAAEMLEDQLLQQQPLEHLLQIYKQQILRLEERCQSLQHNILL